MRGSMAVLNSDRHDDVPGMVDQDPAEKKGIFYRKLRTSDERFLKIRTIFPSSEISISTGSRIVMKIVSVVGARPQAIACTPRGFQFFSHSVRGMPACRIRTIRSAEISSGCGF